MALAAANRGGISEQTHMQACVRCTRQYSTASLATNTSNTPQSPTTTHLCDHKSILSHQLEPNLVGNHTAVAVSNVGKGTGMHQHWGALQGLCEEGGVGFQGVGGSKAGRQGRQTGRQAHTRVWTADGATLQLLCCYTVPTVLYNVSFMISLTLT